MSKFRMALVSSVCFTLLGVSSVALASPEPVKLASTGNIQRDSIIVRISTGDVLRKSGNNEWLPLAIGADLSKNDVLKTGKNSTVLLELPENSGFIRLLPETEIKVSQLKIDRSFEGGQITELSLLKGKVITKVRKFNRKSSNLQINTKGATAAVRGTAFMTSFDNENDKTKVLVGDGKVAVNAQGKEIIVNPKEFTQISNGKSPSLATQVEDKMEFNVASIRPNDGKLIISGVTEPDAESINLNKTSVFPNNDGSFVGNVYLKEGSSTLLVKATTIDGRQKSAVMKVLKFTD